MDRREFLFKGTAYVASAACGLLLPDVAVAKNSTFWSQDRWIDIVRAQTGERRRILFYQNGRYTNGYDELCYMSRDVADGGKRINMDIGVFNMIYAVQEWARQVGVRDPYYTQSSGYRTPAHNNAIEGAAKNSQHPKGRATDGKIRGVDPGTHAAMARYFNVGGVGLYDRFVHTDVGRVRFWRGGY